MSGSMADTVEGLVKRLRDASDGWSGNAWAVDADTAEEAASALEALVVERDEALRTATMLLRNGEEDVRLMKDMAGVIDAAEARALAAEAQRDKAIEALKPFADAAELVEGSPDTSCAGSWITSREHINLVPRASDLRRARSTLNEIEP